LAASYSVARLLRLNDVIDFGGGDGLLCRLLRDYGINCFVADKYAEPKYAPGFALPTFKAPQSKLAFEVLEHLPNPANDLEALFDGEPSALLLSTMLYLGEGPQWSYLSPETGQHVFFYSRKAIDLIATQRGYDVFCAGAYILLTQPGLRLRASIAQVCLRRSLVRAIRAMMNLVPASGVTRDNEAMRSALVEQISQSRQR
jgi:hypothetical protein